MHKPYTQNDILQLVERLGVEDTMDNRGLKTAIRILDGDGVCVHEGLKQNMTVLCGAVSLLETMFHIQPNPAQRILLNDPRILNIPHSVDVLGSLADVSRYPNPWSRSLGFFTIGNGAENPTQAYDYYNPNKYEVELYNSCPFRCVPIGSDLSPSEAAKYRLRKEITIDGNRYYAYYAKAIDGAQTVSITANDVNYLPNMAHQDPMRGDGTTHPMYGQQIRVFTIINITVSQDEFKEWYRLTNNDSLKNARISELGLINALDHANTLDAGRLELASAELFTKLTFEPRPMSSDGARFGVEYIIFS